MGFQPYIENRQDTNGTSRTYLVAEALAVSDANPSDTASGGGQVAVGNGTASLPSLTFQSDLDTGLYRGGANQVNFVVAGSDIVAVSATGVVSTGQIVSTSSTGGLGYSTGAGGTVTQITSASTAVALHTICGQVTTVALTTAAAAEEVFVFNNNTIAATDVVVATTTYAGAGTPVVSFKGIGATACTVVITNLHATDALNAALTFNFVVFNSVAA